QTPQVIIESNSGQRAKSLGKWTLVRTTVASGFAEGGFELAQPYWASDDGSWY
ncbi:hypothetical protein P154DRAFT_423621, partial [Amniculicola lignicola CBS 123094]